MTYKIVSVMPAGEYQDQYGTKVKYNIMFDGEKSACELNQKKSTPAPQVGDELEGEITTDKWGRKFRRSYGGGNIAKNDPNTQKAIIRQNSLTNAVAYCTSKAQLMDKKEALDYLTGKEIIQVATYFAKYSEGKVTVVTESDSKQEKPPQEQTEDNTMSPDEAQQYVEDGNWEG